MLDRESAEKNLTLQTHVWLPQGPNESLTWSDEKAMLEYIANLSQGTTILFAGWGCNCKDNIRVIKTATVVEP